MRRGVGSLAKIVPVILLLHGLTGCSSYEPASSREPLSEEGWKKDERGVTQDSLEIRFTLLADPKISRRLVGITPANARMVPGLLEVSNDSNEVVRVDLAGARLLQESGKDLPSVALDEAIHRALRSDAEVMAWGLGFGVLPMLVAADNSARTNRTLEEDYHAKSFKPTLINPKGKGQGVVFFDYPRGRAPKIHRVVIPVARLTTKDSVEVKIELPDPSMKK
jgi:hypothetical protein